MSWLRAVWQWLQGDGHPPAATVNQSQTKGIMKKKLKGISDIRRYFHRNETPIYFVSATNFNLLGIDEWVRNFRHISHINCFDGRHPNTFVPQEIPHQEFTSIEDINNYRLKLVALTK